MLAKPYPVNEPRTLIAVAVILSRSGNQVEAMTGCPTNDTEPTHPFKNSAIATNLFNIIIYRDCYCNLITSNDV